MTEATEHASPVPSASSSEECLCPTATRGLVALVDHAVASGMTLVTNIVLGRVGGVVTSVAGAALAVPFGIIGAAYGFPLGNAAKTAITLIAYRRILSLGVGAVAPCSRIDLTSSCKRNLPSHE